MDICLRIMVAFPREVEMVFDGTGLSRTRVQYALCNPDERICRYVRTDLFTF